MADFTYVTAPYNKIYDTYIDEHEIVTIDEKEYERIVNELNKK